MMLPGVVLDCCVQFPGYALVVFGPSSVPDHH